MDFEEIPIEIALESLPHMSKHLRLQYDGNPPPLLLALAPKNDENLGMVYTEAQKIYKDINLRVDHLSEQTVGALPPTQLKKFRHVMVISNSLHKYSCLRVNVHNKLCMHNYLQTVSIDLSTEINYECNGGTNGSTLLAKNLRGGSDRLTKISIRLPPEVLDETSEVFTRAKIWRNTFFEDAKRDFESDGGLGRPLKKKHESTSDSGCQVWEWRDEEEGTIIGLRNTK